MRLLIALLVVFVIYSSQLRLYQKYWTKGLSVKLSFSKAVVSYGDKVELIEVIENDKPLALPILNVKFATSRSFEFHEEENANISDHYYRNDIFSILGNQRIERRLGFETTKRGAFRIRELQVSTRDLFLKHPFANIMENEAEIIVLPKRIPMENYAEIRNQLTGDFEVKRWDNPDPFAFRGIRQYQTFDTMSSINWKATARMNELMVNQYQATTESEVKIYLNLKPYMKSQADVLAEHSITIVSTIAADYIERGIRVAFYTNGRDIDSDVPEVFDAVIHDRALRDIEGTAADSENEIISPYLPAGAGSRHMEALDIMLARLDASKHASDFMEMLSTGFEETDHNVTHIIVSTYRDDALYDFFEKQREKKHVYWIIPERESNAVELRYQGMFRWDM